MTETEIAQIIAKWLVQAKARRERKYVHNFFYTYKQSVYIMYNYTIH